MNLSLAYAPFSKIQSYLPFKILTKFLVLFLVWFSFGVTTGCAQAYSSGLEEPYEVMGSKYRLVAGKANALPAVLFLQSQNSEYFRKISSLKC